MPGAGQPGSNFGGEDAGGAADWDAAAARITTGISIAHGTMSLRVVVGESAAAELSFGDLEGERLEVEIAAVGKDDDRHSVGREALDDRPEAHRLPVVPGALASLPRVQKPAEAVGDRAAREQIVAAFVPLGPERLGPLRPAHPREAGAPPP